jgi:hypothetical protein
MMMVKVAKRSLTIEPPRKRRRPRTKQLIRPCVREDHFALLLAASY